ncbi:SGNH/GDSL hydrolase family protein [Streptomyces sp. JJ36]|uniref:SGNH/GDSL hydrolase family protein n=1 Tax=Streptomyces sp. JJ36 TaxID=2736645 RepID=UPI001F27F70A|nr:SGNH/GDSL hydrolase family protein [Streptomyces sp. JJ36]MCF6524758.1 SGNH/GDSL hydrolase family protein [Streptomyces sp. JJ36]
MRDDDAEAAASAPPPRRTPSRARIRTVVAGALLLPILAGVGFAACGDEAPDAGPPPDAHRAEAPARPSPTPSWDRSPDSLAAVGDSITRAFDACSLLADCPGASWATGTDPEIDSLAARLLDDPAKRSWNFAESGALMADLPDQMERAARKAPELVTVMAGGNDACRPTVDAMTPVADFRAQLRRALRVLRREAPGTQVYVASVPNLRRLWSEGRKNPLGRRIWDLGICQSMLRDPQATGRAATQRRSLVHTRVLAYNRVLEEVCATDEKCRYDGGAVFGFRFTEEELSRWDWFHPSREGQRELAELAYRRITAP